MENQADKSQDATPEKLNEARKKGQVGKSVEFVSAASLVPMLVALIISLPKLAHIVSFHLSVWFHNVNQMASSPVLISVYFGRFLSDVLSVVGVIMMLGIAFAALSTLVHVGPVFSLFPLKFDLSKLNPIVGLKKVFSKKGLFDTLKLVLKVIFFSLALAFVWFQINNLILYPTSFSLIALSANWKHVFVVVVSALLFIYVLFALFDLWQSKKEFSHKMKMSMRDIKDEYKKREGNPEIKHKRRKNMLALLRNISGMSKLKDADVIITNPTHVAVALKYRSKIMVYPTVLVKGKGFFALWIIKKARSYGVPIMQRPPLARKIYADSEVKGIIPVSEQHQVAEIYKEIIKMPGNKVYS